MRFSEWKGGCRLSELSSNEVPQDAGVYIISVRQKINRAHGVDENGILDVGESGNLRERIKAFYSCARGSRKEGHMAGWRFREFDLNSVFPIDSLYIFWKTCSNKAAAEVLEGEILSEYLSQHYELPPLNYKFNWKR